MYCYIIHYYIMYIIWRENYFGFSWNFHNPFTPHDPLKTAFTAQSHVLSFHAVGLRAWTAAWWGKTKKKKKKKERCDTATAEWLPSSAVSGRSINPMFHPFKVEQAFLGLVSMNTRSARHEETQSQILLKWHYQSAHVCLSRWTLQRQEEEELITELVFHFLNVERRI